MLTAELVQAMQNSPLNQHCRGKAVEGIWALILIIGFGVVGLFAFQAVVAHPAIVGIAVASLILAWYLGSKRKTNNRKAQVESLEKNGFVVAKIYRSTTPWVLFDMASKQVAFVSTHESKRLPLSDIIEWEHTWKTSPHTAITTDHRVVINVRGDIQRPVVRVACAGARDGKDLHATLNAAVNS